MTGRILLLDDSLTVRMDVAGALEDAGFEVVACATLEAAREAVHEGRFELAILDVLLPDGNGTQLLSELRASTATEAMPILLLSRESAVRERIAGLERGADGYFAKPYDLSALVGRARELLGVGAGRAPTVLVIDDSLTFCHAVRSGLVAGGRRVILAATAEQGLRIARERHPDAILIDQVLPGMDGATFVRRVRLDPGLQRVPCLLMTASDESDDEVAALDAGADAFVRKDAGVDGVLARLEVLLRSTTESRLTQTRPLGRGAKRVLLLTWMGGVDEWIRPVLDEDGHEVVEARGIAEGLHYLGLSRVDCALLEAHADLPETVALVREIRAASRFDSIAVVVLSLRGDEGAAEALDAGADEWLSAEGVRPDVVRARIGALLRRRDIEERERRINAELVERARRLSESNDALRVYQQLVEALPVGALILSRDAGGGFRIDAMNAAVEELTGLEHDRALGRPLHSALPGVMETDLPDRFEAAMHTGRPQRLSQLTWAPLGEDPRRWDVQAVRLGGDKLGVLAEDVTERERIRARAEAGQRMEAVGKLAGGVAHDFNNLLTVIQWYAEFVREKLAADAPLRTDLDAILDAAGRASGLTRQLLAFSRKQVQQLEVLELNRIIVDVEKMLRRVLGEDIALETVLDPELGFVKADSTHLEQVLMNLVVNARDAMPTGGALTIETSNVELEESYGGRKGVSVEAGRYAMIAVSDTGCGIPQATLDHIFEPFFTTKPEGKGTGLGLSTVYGVIKQAGGFVWVYSEPGRGTTFKVYLPRVEGAVAAAETSAREVATLDGTETVLLVEDDALVRRAAERILAKHGYRALSAPDGPTACAVVESHQGPLDVLLTDVVMPEMSGKDVAAWVRARRPETRVIYMSGYTGNVIAHHGVADVEGASLLQKPFTTETLLRQLRGVLDAT